MLLLMLPLLLPGLLAWDPADGPEPWTQEELALFELVDEVNGTFYELMDLTRNATKTDIKNRYKEMAVELHPDKNPEKEDEFKQLAAVYNMLKVKRTRAMYHRVLDEGLPDFRIPAFYERKVQVVRHIGLAEGIVTLLVLATLVQYGMAWAAFLERKFNSKMEKKKREKKPKKNQKEVEKTPEKEVSVKVNCECQAMPPTRVHSPTERRNQLTKLLANVKWKGQLEMAVWEKSNFA